VAEEVRAVFSLASNQAVILSEAQSAKSKDPGDFHRPPHLTVSSSKTERLEIGGYIKFLEQKLQRHHKRKSRSSVRIDKAMPAVSGTPELTA
jgi:hypothetical protein